MSNEIRHAGVIDAIENQHIRVRIVQQAACASCKVASRCNASDAKEKIVDVFRDAKGLSIGQHVVVSTSGKAVWYAMLLGFGCPLVLLLVMLVTAKACGRSDGFAALLSVGALVPYYIMVWLFRAKVARQISFRLETT